MYEEHAVMYKRPKTFDDAVDRAYTTEEMAMKKRNADPKKSAFQFGKGFQQKGQRVGDWIFLKTSPMKGTIRFGQKGKLSPGYVGPFEIKSRIGDVAYRLKLLSEFARVRDVFHVSMLRKYIRDPSHNEVQIKADSTYVEHPLCIIDKKEQVLRTGSGWAPYF
ncbi:hypothetical protein MRB53_026220 [Persea americana]|uniref:Uncharacterized protein n=1 Tax=Persea americana TaxID=3435 RepID=A0ACC2LHH0_PERAE|nr:hypothetical protein MRB53_026220 [Persea americana]